MVEGKLDLTHHNQLYHLPVFKPVLEIVLVQEANTVKPIPAIVPYLVFDIGEAIALLPSKPRFDYEEIHNTSRKTSHSNLGNTGNNIRFFVQSKTKNLLIRQVH